MAQGEVHRGRSVGVRADQPTGVGAPCLRRRVESVDHVAAVRRQAGHVGLGAPPLGVLAGDARDLDDGHRGPVGQDHGHLQQRPDRPAQVQLGVVDEGLRAIPPCNRNASPRATIASRSWSLSTSAGTAIGGTLSSTQRTRSTSSGSGHPGCCAAGRASASLTAAARTPGSGGSEGGLEATSTVHVTGLRLWDAACLSRRGSRRFRWHATTDRAERRERCHRARSGPPAGRPHNTRRHRAPGADRAKPPPWSAPRTCSRSPSRRDEDRQWKPADPLLRNRGKGTAQAYAAGGREMLFRWSNESVS